MLSSTTSSKRDSSPKRSGELYTDAELDRVYDYVALGKTISEIAKLLDRPHSGVQAIVLTYPERYEEAKEKRRDLIRRERWDRAFSRDDKWSAKFLDDLAMEQLPEAREARKDVNAPSPEEVHAGHIAQALERFAAAVVSRATERGAAELPDGTE